MEGTEVCPNIFMPFRTRTICEVDEEDSCARLEDVGELDGLALVGAGTRAGGICGTLLREEEQGRDCGGDVGDGEHLPEQWVGRSVDYTL